MAEMRRQRVGPRYFYPWDPLQLSCEASGGGGGEKAQVVLRLYRTFRRRLYWSPLLHTSYLQAGEPSWALDLLKRMAQDATKSRGAFSVEAYSWKASDDLLALDDEERGFRYHPYEGSLASILDALEAFLKEVDEEIAARGIKGEPPTKPLQLLALLPPREAWEELVDPSLRRRFVTLLEALPLRRAYLFVFLPQETFTSLAPHEEEAFFSLLPAFSQVALLGEAAPLLKEEVFPEKKVGDYSFSQEEVGLLYDSLHEELLPLHPWVYTPSAWKVEQQAAQEEEERLYREFLTSLDDGSSS